MKDFEEKLRKQYELQEKLDEIHSRQGTAQYHNGSLNGNAVEIDLSKVKNGKHQIAGSKEEMPEDIKYEVTV